MRAVAPWAGAGGGGIFPHYPYNYYRLSTVIPLSAALNYRFLKSNFMPNFMVQISVCYIINYPFFLKLYVPFLLIFSNILPQFN